VRVNTPQIIVDQLAKDIGRAIADPDLQQWLAKHGAKPMKMRQPEFARFVVSESENAKQFVKVGEIGSK
jgi:tripartite-type tricarboxylate transporter receptor subunit TctC